MGLPPVASSTQPRLIIPPSVGPNALQTVGENQVQISGSSIDRSLAGLTPGGQALGSGIDSSCMGSNNSSEGVSSELMTSTSTGPSLVGPS
jgi:hypothetical protein